MSESTRELTDVGIERLRIEIGAGVVEIVPIDGEQTHATLEALQGSVEDVIFKVSGNELVVEAPRQVQRRAEYRVRIQTPGTPAARIKTGSGDIVTRARLREARLSSGSGSIRVTHVEGGLAASAGSGDIRLEHGVGTVRAVTGSGSIDIATAEGAIALSTGSGDVRVGDAGGITTVKVGSGDITIERIRDHSVVTSGSGDVRVEAADGPSVRAETARGNVQIGVPDGVPTYLDLKTVTGRIRCDLEPSRQPGEDERSLMLRARTVSGDITVIRS